MTDPKSAIDVTVARLRADALALPAGSSLGSEEALLQRFCVSRPTMRQAARILEREGVLKVRRGNNGGYFTARPDAQFIEATVASYLESLHARPDDLIRIASALWVEAVAKAARIATDTPGDIPRLLARVRTLKPEAGFEDVMAIERKVRRHVFDRIDSPYVELIFDINANFARRSITEPAAACDGDPDHAAFLSGWRKAMTMQLSAIADGDEEIAILAARRCRALIHERVWHGH